MPEVILPIGIHHLCSARGIKGSQLGPSVQDQDGNEFDVGVQ
jgi:hypothetical protein